MKNKKLFSIIISVALTLSILLSIFIVPVSASSIKNTYYQFSSNLEKPSSPFESYLDFVCNNSTFNAIKIVVNELDSTWQLVFINTNTVVMATVYQWHPSDPSLTGWTVDYEAFNDILISDFSRATDECLSFILNNSMSHQDLMVSGYHSLNLDYLTSLSGSHYFDFTFDTNSERYYSIGWYGNIEQQAGYLYFESQLDWVEVATWVDGKFIFNDQEFELLYFREGVAQNVDHYLSFYKDLFIPLTLLPEGSYKFNDGILYPPINHNDVYQDFNLNISFYSCYSNPYHYFTLSHGDSGLIINYLSTDSNYPSVCAYSKGSWNSDYNLITILKSTYVPTLFYDWFIENTSSFSYTPSDPPADDDPIDPDVPIDPDDPPEDPIDPPVDPILPEAYYTVTGLYIFNEVLTRPDLPFEYNLSFISNDYSFNLLFVSHTNTEDVLTFGNSSNGHVGGVYVWHGDEYNGWDSPDFMSLNFTNASIPSSLYNWLRSNGTFYVEVDSDPTLPDLNFEPIKTWDLVTDVNSLSAGDVIVIVATSYPYAISTTQNTNNRPGASVLKENNQLIFGSDVQIITLAEGFVSGSFALMVGDSYLRTGSSSSNTLKTSDKLDSSSSWVITINNGFANIVAQSDTYRNYLQYNASSNLFACYASDSQSGLSIYKLAYSYEHIYENGYNTGYNRGYTEGYTSGYSTGFELGKNVGYNSGYNDSNNSQVSGDFGFNVLSSLFTAPIEFMDHIVLAERISISGAVTQITLWSIFQTILLTCFAYFIIKLIVK